MEITKKDEKVLRIKFSILRILFITVFSILGIVSSRYKWLAHYLKGSGSTLKLLKKDFDWGVVLQSLRRQAWDYYEGPLELGERWELPKSCCAGHSTLYEGTGFWGRPEMFYLVGGFTFHLRTEGKGETKKVVVSGEDVYDWHPADDHDNYFTSALPRGLGWVIYPLRTFMGKKFSEWYFPIKGFPMGNPGICNRVWQHMEVVGAKEFNTEFEFSMNSNKFGQLVKRIVL